MNKNTIIIAGVVILGAGVAFYLYKKSQQPVQQQPVNGNQQSGNGTADIINAAGNALHQVTDALGI